MRSSGRSSARAGCSTAEAAGHQDGRAMELEAEGWTKGGGGGGGGGRGGGGGGQGGGRKREMKKWR